MKYIMPLSLMTFVAFLGAAERYEDQKIKYSGKQIAKMQLATVRDALNEYRGDKNSGLAKAYKDLLDESKKDDSVEQIFHVDVMERLRAVFPSADKFKQLKHQAIVDQNQKVIEYIKIRSTLINEIRAEKLGLKLPNTVNIVNNKPVEDLGKLISQEMSHIFEKESIAAVFEKNVNKAGINILNIDEKNIQDPKFGVSLVIAAYALLWQNVLDLGVYKMVQQGERNLIPFSLNSVTPSVNTSINIMNDELESVHEKINKQGEQLTLLEVKTDKLGEKIDSVQLDMKNSFARLDKEIGILDTKLTINGEKIDSNTASISALETDVKKNKADIKLLQEVSATAGTVTIKQNKDIEKLEKETERLEKKKSNKWSCVIS